jgi:hypothetical protein
MDGHTAVGYGGIEPNHPLYKGRRYDSDLECNVAKRLDELGIAYTPQANISDNKLCKAVYQPKSGVIARHRDEGISGLDDLLKFLNGMPPSDIVAQRKAGGGR